MRDEKEGRKKQEKSNKQQGKATQHTYPRQSFFVRKMSCLGWDSNPRHSTLDMYMYIHYTSVSLAVFQVVYVCDMYLYDVHMCIVCVRVCVCVPLKLCCGILTGGIRFPWLCNVYCHLAGR